MIRLPADKLHTAVQHRGAIDLAGDKIKGGRGRGLGGIGSSQRNLHDPHVRLGRLTFKAQTCRIKMQPVGQWRAIGQPRSKAQRVAAIGIDKHIGRNVDTEDAAFVCVLGGDIAVQQGRTIAAGGGGGELAQQALHLVCLQQRGLAG